MTIIISTYGTPEYLKECVESIFSCKLDISIIIGIDGCIPTLDYVKTNKTFSPCNIFYFPETVGPYIIKNNLVKEVKEENIIFFDSDDIMLPNLISECEKHIDKGLVKFGFQELIGGRLGDKGIGWGVFGIKKSLFQQFYFQNWICNADLEFTERLKFNHIPQIEIKNTLFLRRVHSQSLTKRQDTGMDSELRRSYQNTIKEKKEAKTWFNPKPLIIDYEKILLT